MKPVLKTDFVTKDGDTGVVITQRRIDGTYITTYKPMTGLAFHSIDSDKVKSHETVKSFLRDVKGCIIHGDSDIPADKNIEKIRKFLV